VPIAAIMTFGFDDRMLFIVVAALAAMLAVLSVLNGRVARAAPTPAPRPQPACPGDWWCPGPHWHIFLTTGHAPAGQVASFFAAGSGRPMLP